MQSSSFFSGVGKEQVAQFIPSPKISLGKEVKLEIHEDKKENVFRRKPFERFRPHNCDMPTGFLIMDFGKRLWFEQRTRT